MSFSSAAYQRVDDFDEEDAVHTMHHVLDNLTKETDNELQQEAMDKVHNLKTQETRGEWVQTVRLSHKQKRRV